MAWLIWTIPYLALHFALYGLVLRHMRPFLLGRNVLVYHLVSELAWPIVLTLGGLTGVWTLEREGLAAWIAILSVHGIYSLTFLSAWSLASGGYSLGILQFAQSRGGLRLPLERQPLEDIGVQKQEDRLTAVRQLRLVQPSGPRFELTPRGSRFASVLALIAWAYDVREIG